MFSEEELGPFRNFLKMQERMSDAFSDKEMDKQVADEITATLRKAGITPEQAQNMSPEVSGHASVGLMPVLKSGLYAIAAPWPKMALSAQLKATQAVPCLAGAV